MSDIPKQGEPNPDNSKQEITDKQKLLQEDLAVIQNDPKPTEAGNSSKKKELKDSFWFGLPFLTFLLFIATFILGVAGLWQSCNISKQTKAIERQAAIADSQWNVSKKQLDSTHIQLDISRNVSIRQLRAYLYIIDKKLDSVNYYQKKFSLINGGQTPAYKVRAWYSTDTVTFKRKPDFGQPKDYKGDSTVVTLSPGQSYSFSTHFFPNQYTLHLMKTGKAIIYTWGEVTYDDSFGNHRFTRMRLKTILHHDLTSETRVCEEGNESN